MRKDPIPLWRRAGWYLSLAFAILVALALITGLWRHFWPGG
ncbi:hypothetical protein [Allosphingosinicella sp.]